MRLLMRDEGHLGGPQRTDAVVRGLQVDTFEDRECRRGVKGHDLPFAVLDDLVAAAKTLKHQARLGRAVSLADDIRISGRMLSPAMAGRAEPPCPPAIGRRCFRALAAVSALASRPRERHVRT
jgi:hypothetical protein